MGVDLSSDNEAVLTKVDLQSRHFVGRYLESVSLRNLPRSADLLDIHRIAGGTAASEPQHDTFLLGAACGPQVVYRFTDNGATAPESRHD
jgi:hypothetical protein